MSRTSLESARILRRKARTRASLATNQELPRLSVHRTLRSMYAQIIDDKAGRTLAAVNGKSLGVAGSKTDVATAIGKAIAEKALAAGVIAVRFDRGAFRYHGRVAALAAAARENGLTF